MTNISINKLHEFRDHPYQVLDNERNEQLNRERSTTGDYDAADCTTA